MKLFRVAQRCISAGLYHHQCNQLHLVKTLSTYPRFGGVHNDSQNSNSFETNDDFERRIFSGLSGEDSSSFYRKLDRIEKARTGPGMDADLHGFGPGDEDNESFSTLNDGLEGKLKKAATYFEVNDDEIEEDGYCFRPDSNLRHGMTYTPQDLDLRRPAVWKPVRQAEFEVTTEEVLRKADFRNVRFLANFLTDAGIIIKRSKTGISAKAQRKVAREIKTARAFGLLPFTTMGTKAFVFGKTMEDLDQDFMVETYDDPGDVDVEDSI